MSAPDPNNAVEIYAAPSKEVIEACFSHARNLLRAAKRVNEDEQLPNITFHLATLALEEIGKASLLRSRDIASEFDDDTGFIDKRLDDHVFKLFWAIWTPVFARGAITQDEIESIRSLAKQIHEDRKEALYVSWETGAAAPLKNISQEFARWLISLSETRLELESSQDWGRFDLSKNSDARWFFDATYDQETRKMIFGGESFKKLGEFRNVREWIKWLRQQFYEAEQQAALRLKAELEQPISERADRGEDRWRLRLRLYSSADSVRPKALGIWNQGQTWIKLSPVENQKQQLDVEFTFGDRLSLHNLGPMAQHVARLFVVSLNIASLGLWWWHSTNHYGELFERISDLKSPNADIPMDLSMRGNPGFEWHRKALKQAEIERLAMCFGAISRLSPEEKNEIIEPYMAGLGLLAKSDMHINLSASACERFSKALQGGLRHFIEWDGSNESLPNALTQVFPKMPGNDREELLDLMRRFDEVPPNTEGLTLERAAVLKLLADALFINAFGARMQQIYGVH